MGKLDDFDLDITIKKSTKKGVEPALTTTSPNFCSTTCPTGPVRCGKQSK